jgi:molybdate transport system substrate-binding protein
MKRRSLVTGMLLAQLAGVALAGVEVHAAEVKLLCATAMRSIVEELAPKFERATGHRLAATFATLGAIVKRVQDGEGADLVIIPGQGVEGLVKAGKAAADGVVPIARSGMGVAVGKDATKPDISSPEALKRALLAARSITYSNPAHGGGTGTHFAGVLEKLGIANEMKAKTVFLPQPGAVGALVARGEVEIAVSQVQELLQVSGLDIVGPLPSEVQYAPVFTSIVMAGASNVDAAKALVAFLRTPEAAAVMKAQGVEPAAP